MRTITCMLAQLCWALWFGGMITLFISVQVLFRHDRSVAVQAAPVMFDVFGKYQIGLGVVAVVAAIASRPRGWLVGLLIVATLLAIGHMLFIEAPMDRLRAEGQSSSDHFKHLHGYSMMVYVSQAGLLLIAGALIPRAIRTSSGTAPA